MRAAQFGSILALPPPKSVVPQLAVSPLTGAVVKPLGRSIIRKFGQLIRPQSGWSCGFRNKEPFVMINFACLALFNRSGPSNDIERGRLQIAGSLQSLLLQHCCHWVSVAKLTLPNKLRLYIIPCWVKTLKVTLQGYDVSQAIPVSYRLTQHMCSKIWVGIFQLLCRQ